MRNTARIAAGVFVVALASVSAPAQDTPDTTIREGRTIAFERSKGNCLACHAVAGGVFPGDIGPPLVAMQKRFSSKEQIRSQIQDPRTNNPNTVMPPFGAHGILTEDEIDKVVEFIWTL